MLEMARHIYEFILNDWYTNINWEITAVLVFMILIHLPIIGYQLYSQCGNLCKRPVNTFQSSSNMLSDSGESQRPDGRTEHQPSITGKKDMLGSDSPLNLNMDLRHSENAVMQEENKLSYVIASERNESLTSNEKNMMRNSTTSESLTLNKLRDKHHLEKER